MKTFKFTKSLSILIALVLTTLVACKKDDNKPDDNNKTDAELRTELLTTENDNRAYGVYTGTLIGSSGYFELFIKQANSKITVVFDGKTYELTSDKEIVPGADVINYVFKNSEIQITFSVKNDGSNPIMTVEKDGHDIIVIIGKIYTYYNIHNFVGTAKSEVDCAIDYTNTITFSGGVNSGKFIYKNTEDGSAMVTDIIAMTLNTDNLTLTVKFDSGNETFVFEKTGTNTYYHLYEASCDQHWNITKVN